MNEILEIKGKIYEVIDGQVTKIKVDDTIFEIKSPETKTEELDIEISKIPKESFVEEIPKKEEPKIKKQNHRGKFLGIEGKCYIYENILNDIKEAISEGKSFPELMTIIKRYSPSAKDITLHWYVNRYKSFIKKKSPRDLISDFEMERGKVVGRLNKLSICKNVLKDISDAIDENKQKPEMIKIIEKYYPNVTYPTRRVYLSIYRRFLGKKPIYQVDLAKGQKIAIIYSAPIHSNILDECRVEKEKGNYDFTDIIKKYYPDLVKRSIEKYCSVYRKYLGVSLKRGQRIKKKNIFDKFFVEKKKTKRRRRKPKGTVGYCKTYKTWIKKDEYLAVKRAVNSWNFVATSESISKKTRIPYYRLKPILRYLTDKKEIYWKKNSDHKVIYHPCI